MLVNCSLGHAANVQLVAGVQSAQFLNSVNLTESTPTAFISADWSFDNGSYTGVNCYLSDADSSQAVANGCDLYLGYFKEINKTNAISIQLTRHQYSRAINTDWDFTDFSLSWHPSKTSILSLTFTENWLDRPYDTFSIQAEKLIPLGSGFGLNLSASFMEFESNAPVSNLTAAKAAFTFNHQRWITELAFIYTDDDQSNILPFDINQPDVLLSIGYRLY